MKLKYILPSAIMAAMGLSSCVNDLDVTPIDPSTNMTVDADALFNKCYANFALQGNGGHNGDCDIEGIDGGTTPFVRQMWNANELTSDEAICAWPDEGISSYNYAQCDASHPMLKGLYYRLYFGVTICNHYLQTLASNDAQRTAEVRFLRALSYYHLCDLWGNVPFITKMAGGNARQGSREEIAQFVEQELLECVGDMAEPGQNTYGRADKAAAWMLLARLYLNYEVYTGVAKWAEAAEYAQKVMNTGYYRLNTTESASFEVTFDGNTESRKWSAYQMLFMGDNGESDARYEAVFPIVYDGQKTSSWGGSLFLIAGTFSTNMYAYVNDSKNIVMTNGLDQNWAGNRARKCLIEKFFPQGDEAFEHMTKTNAEGVDEVFVKDSLWNILDKAGDDRALFSGKGCTLEVRKPENFTDGFGVMKFLGIHSDFSDMHDKSQSDADFMLMRVAEAYLTYAEALMRQNGGQANADALSAVNAIRTRAHAKSFTAADLTLDELCDEWSREFYFEGRRRSDLIRFGKYAGNTDYNWEWKNGVYNGVALESKRNVFAIPSDDLIANSNLQQNEGY